MSTASGASITLADGMVCCPCEPFMRFQRVLVQNFLHNVQSHTFTFNDGWVRFWGQVGKLDSCPGRRNVEYFLYVRDISRLVIALQKGNGLIIFSLVSVERRPSRMSMS